MLGVSVPGGSWVWSLLRRSTCWGCRARGWPSLAGTTPANDRAGLLVPGLGPPRAVEALSHPQLLLVLGQEGLLVPALRREGLEGCLGLGDRVPGGLGLALAVVDPAGG